MLLSEQTGTKETSRGSCTVFIQQQLAKADCVFSRFCPLHGQLNGAYCCSAGGLKSLLKEHSFFALHPQFSLDLKRKKISIILYTGMFHNRNRRKILFLLQKGFHCNCKAQRSSPESMCEDSGTQKSLKIQWDGKIVIQDLLKPNILLLFLPRSMGCDCLPGNLHPPPLPPLPASPVPTALELLCAKAHETAPLRVQIRKQFDGHCPRPYT